MERTFSSFVREATLGEALKQSHLVQPALIRRVGQDDGQVYLPAQVTL